MPKGFALPQKCITSVLSYSPLVLITSRRSEVCQWASVFHKAVKQGYKWLIRPTFCVFDPDLPRFKFQSHTFNMTGQLVWLVTGCSSGLGEAFVRAILAKVYSSRQSVRVV